MPISEREYHPYIFLQLENFDSKNNLDKYNKAIFGTFPIYAITESDPIENAGLIKKDNWRMDAWLKYFYGSLGNSFWSLFANAFNEEVPNTVEEAIRLLNKYGFLLIDTFIAVFRNGYSPLDSDIIDPIPNHYIFNLLENCINLKTIYFTGIDAKKSFCKILNIRCPTSKDSLVTIFNKDYRLIDLITPAGNARSAYHYRHNLNLTQEEISNRLKGSGYALAYRKRYYTHYLNTRNN